MSAALRIAILAHSTNPRGGVVHALELGDALTGLGHDVTVFGPDAAGRGFFRKTLCQTSCLPAAPVGPGTLELVRVRMGEYLDYFLPDERRRFDIWHAQDGISGNALASLAERRLIPGFVRTVHHVDDFGGGDLAILQRRAIVSARGLFVVSRLWQDWLRDRLGRASTIVGNGVDSRRFTPAPDETDAALAARLNLPTGARMFLAVGGVEERKNTQRILAAFAEVHEPGSILVIAGGASLLDHGAYQAQFANALSSSGLPADAVIRTGPLPDSLMPALYRRATALVFPSVKEGFGLVVLEAMASGVPVVAPRIAPFTEYLAPSDVAWCNPTEVGSIAGAIRIASDAGRRAGLTERGHRVAARFSWDRVARAHLQTYAAMRETEHA